MSNLHDRLKPIAAEIVTARIPLRQALVVIERELIEAALEKSNGVVTRAAAMLGVHRNTLMNKKAPSPRAMKLRERKARAALAMLQRKRR